MYQNIDLFRLSSGLAQHAAARQSVIARNIANADTPNYQAQDLPAFSTAYDAPMAMTHAGHIQPSVVDTVSPAIRNDGYREPNGNTVALETEMVAAAEIRQDHSRAMAIYRSSMAILQRVVG